MMRTSLLRQAAASRVALAAARPARLLCRPSQSATATAAAPAAVHRPLGSLLRFYSSESHAASAPSAPSNGTITRFADLPQLGVNDTLVRAITHGMGYETMTDVQCLTINPALAGKDV